MQRPLFLLSVSQLYADSDASFLDIPISNVKLRFDF